MEDPRGGAQHAREFYESWDFVRTAVDLYCAGVSWRGASLVVVGRGDGTRTVGELDGRALREVLPAWFIDGSTTFFVSETEPIRILPSGEGKAIEFLSPPAPGVNEPGLTMLWPACSNTPAIKEMIEAMSVASPVRDQAIWLVETLFDFAFRGLHVPSWAVDPKKAASASAEQVSYELHFYRLFVGQWRDSLEHILGKALSEELGIPRIYVHWNDEWSPSGDGWVGVYEAFRDCGLELTRFREEYLGTLQQGVALGLFPRSVLDPWR